MMKYYIPLLFLMLFGFVHTQEYFPNQVVVKFKTDSKSLRIWKSNNRTGEIEMLKGVLGENTTKPFISNKIIGFLNISSNNESLILQSNVTPKNIDNIAVITYKSDIDAVVASNKIAELDEIEYAEPMYIRKIVGIPNDTLLGKQYYVGIINAIDAWDYLDTNKKITIAVVDTGVDYDHPDLKESIFMNSGEMGLDSAGNDKRQNGIDDDNNEFIDDWHGYDFNSTSDSTGYDSDPKPGNPHGTHVSGICAATVDNVTGIAGVSKVGRVLPVKIGVDSYFSGSLQNSYDGILYGALMNASVINCSWGGGGRSQSEQEVIDVVLSKGSMIVAAAGNDNTFAPFYPASYDGVFSVAASDDYDRKASFSNYHSSVDISAPGATIMSTLPDDNYAAWDGTSMASPVVAGVAAMVRSVFPELSPIQIQEQIRATSDSIYTKNEGYLGKLGKGRVNAFKAVSNRTAKLVSLSSYVFSEANNNKAFEPNEKVELNLELINLLRDVGKVSVIAKIRSEYNFVMLNDKVTFTKIDANEKVSTNSINNPIVFIIPSELPSNYSIVVDIDITDGETFTNSYSLSVVANPTYRTIKKNDITVTITSLGKFAYNDYPNNVQGDGFGYKNFQDLIYEGSLIIGNSYSQIANNARGSSGSYANRDFEIIKPISLTEKDDYISTLATFKSIDDSTVSKVKVIYSAYEFLNKSKDSLLNDALFLQYDVINTSDKYTDSLFLGMYHDWDLGPSGANNFTKWVKEGNFTYVMNTKIDSMPYIGIKQLTTYNNNYYAVDNDGNSEDNMGVYDGFLLAEKWKMLTGGMGRQESTIGDVSVVIGAGPIKLRENDTARVVFVVFCGKSLEDLTQKANYLQSYSKNIINIDGNFSSKPNTVYISKVNPNPNNGEFLLEYGVPAVNRCSVSIYDINGKLISTIHNSGSMDFGIYQLKVSNLNLAQGKYFINLDTDKGFSSVSLIIAK